MKKVYKKTIRFFTAVLLVILCVIAYYYFAYRELTVSEYQIPADINAPIRIVHLSDLHNREFGENNSELISLVAEQKPDLIFMSGDMLNRDDPNTEIVSNLIESLVPIAPVYFGYGNHEYSWELNYEKDLRQIFTDAGAIVVNNDYVNLEVNGQALRIGGYMGYYRQPHMFPVDREQKYLELAFADDFENTDRLKLLINHIPTAWLDWGGFDQYPADVVFSGHYHGGTIRLPILERGLYAPYVGWFPPFTKGVYAGEKATCVLSAGLGNEHHIPRINNPPEIVVADLVPLDAAFGR